MFRRVKASALAVAILAFALAAGGGDSKASLDSGKGFQRLATINGTSAGAVAMARTADGRLHLVYQTYAGHSLSGLGSRSITAAGTASSQVQALANWQAGMPGLLALPNGPSKQSLARPRPARSKPSGASPRATAARPGRLRPTSAEAGRTSHSPTAPT